MTWWPRQTPRTGTSPPRSRTMSTDSRASRGCPGPGGITTPAGAHLAHVRDGAGVVAPHDRLGAQLPQVLDQVEHERVVVVDDQDPQAPPRVAQHGGGHGVSAPLS